jgi:hypothetical protein
LDVFLVADNLFRIKSTVDAIQHTTERTAMSSSLNIAEKIIDKKDKTIK